MPVWFSISLDIYPTDDAAIDPQKIPIYKRLANTITRQKGSAQQPLIQRSYGPRVEQEIRSGML